MSGWDASSRPTWDPQGGEGENTQSFGVPESWNSPQEPPEGGFPGSASPGTPPDIFLQDYDSNEFAPNDFAPNGATPNGVGRHAAPPHRGNGHRGRAPQEPTQREPAPWDRGQEDYPGQDYPGQDYPGQDYPGQDYPGQDYPGQDYPSRGYRAPELPERPERAQRPERPERPERFDRPDPRDRGYADPLGYRDADQAARVDPALRDFFAPPPDRPDAGRQAPGQQRFGASGYAGQNREPWGPPPPDDRRPYQDSPPRRPGPRSGHRQEAPARRSGLTALVVVAVVVVIGIGVGAYMLLNRGNSTPQSTGGTPTTTPTSSPQATHSAAPPAKTVGYTLTAPATAGGYSALSKIPTAIMNTASTTTAAMSGPALSDGGGKIAGKGVAAAYQLSSGQVMTFIGYEGTFNPAKVLSNLASLGTTGKPYPAGPHGGDLACATAPGTPSGTVCIWTTTTTLAVTEFFASDESPEVVTDQAKAASDTLKLRNSVEVPK